MSTKERRAAFPEFHVSSSELHFQGTVEELQVCFFLKQRKWDPNVENVKNTDDNVSLMKGLEAGPGYRGDLVLTCI